jgi:hypothetical protein
MSSRNVQRLLVYAVSALSLGLNAQARAETQHVSNADVDCIAVDLYDPAHRMTFGDVQEHTGSLAYPSEWSEPTNIPWQPDHSETDSPVIIDSHIGDALRLTGRLTGGIAGVQFDIPSSLPDEAKRPTEVFLNATAINAFRLGWCRRRLLCTVDLIFSGAGGAPITETYALRIGENIRNWWSGEDTTNPTYVFDLNDFGPTSDAEARTIKETVPRAGGLAGFDVQRLIVPPRLQGNELVAIRLTAHFVRNLSQGLDVSVRLGAISLFYGMTSQIVDPNTVLLDGNDVTTDTKKLIMNAPPCVALLPTE